MLKNSQKLNMTMTMPVNRETYSKLIEEDLVWLNKQPRSLERNHIENILLKEQLMFSNISNVGDLWHEGREKPRSGSEILVKRDKDLYYGKYVGGRFNFVRGHLEIKDGYAEMHALIDRLIESDCWIYLSDIFSLQK